MSALEVPEVDAGLDDRPERVDRLPAALQEQLRLLAQEAELLQLSNRERAIQTELLGIEERLRNRSVLLTDAQRDLLRSSIEYTQSLRAQAEVLEQIQGPQEELENRQEALNELLLRGAITAQQFALELNNINLAQAELNIAQGEGTFFDGFILGVENMLEAIRNFSSEAGMLFADFFEQSSQGFADAAANAIVFGENFEDAIGNAARRALADLLSGLIRLGLQMVINATLGNTLSTTATATAQAQGAALAAAYATPAALASLASFGANAVPAQAGIVSTVGISNALAIPGFADGGMVRGTGGPRSDSIPAMLSNGEFVVNARSTARFRPLLEQINSPRGFQDGGVATPTTGSNAGPNQDTPARNSEGNLTVMNVLDPSLLDNYVQAPQGSRTLLNFIQGNAPAIQQILRNN